MRLLTPKEVAAFQPESPLATPAERLARAQAAMQEAGCWVAGQQMGHRWPIACVALEITQRCNMDCTSCYLSEHSEAVRDIPIEEIFRRVSLIHGYFGEGTNVQITGGEPTLRQRDELLAIVRRVRDEGMRSTLMTNGIRASRQLLGDLSEAGLTDVAFHVDTTQGIKGYPNEKALNAVRERYLDRIAALPLSVMFNTTVHAGNFEELPDLVRFFRRHAARIQTVSFQSQAQTGRGIAGPRPSHVTRQSIEDQIRRGAETAMRFDTLRIGHPDCTGYAVCLALHGKLYDVLDEPEYIGRLDSLTRAVDLDRTCPMRSAARVLGWLVHNPGEMVFAVGWATRKLRQTGWDLVRARGRLATLSFVVHNFMDADSLDRERICACVFKVMTRDGPVSMCLHNARRDEFILAPVRLPGARGERFWQPLTGQTSKSPVTATGVYPESHPVKRLKGRTRQRVTGKPGIKSTTDLA